MVFESRGSGGTDLGGLIQALQAQVFDHEAARRAKKAKEDLDREKAQRDAYFTDRLSIHPAARAEMEFLRRQQQLLEFERGDAFARVDGAIVAARDAKNRLEMIERSLPLVEQQDAKSQAYLITTQLEGLHEEVRGKAILAVWAHLHKAKGTFTMLSEEDRMNAKQAYVDSFNGSIRRVDGWTDRLADYLCLSKKATLAAMRDDQLFLMAKVPSLESEVERLRDLAFAATERTGEEISRLGNQIETLREEAASPVYGLAEEARENLLYKSVQDPTFRKVFDAYRSAAKLSKSEPEGTRRNEEFKMQFRSRLERSFGKMSAGLNALFSDSKSYRPRPGVCGDATKDMKERTFWTYLLFDHENSPKLAEDGGPQSLGELFDLDDDRADDIAYRAKSGYRIRDTPLDAEAAPSKDNSDFKWYNPLTWF